MVIENVMYFALGALAAALLALIILPAVWRRAVRLTKKRIEAATPLTLAEFRADKDQLRAEFALSTRRLEMNVEALRKRLAEQIGDISRKKNDLSSIKAERDQFLAQIRELEEREEEARRRVLELEKEGADLAQRLRMRDREFAEKVTQLETAREAMRGGLPRGVNLDGDALSGDYDKDVEELLTALAIERKRSAFLDNQSRALIAQAESSNRKSSDTAAAMTALRGTLAEKDAVAEQASSELVAAEARIADAESQLNLLLEETHRIVETGEARHEQLLAEKLSLEDQLEQLRGKVTGVESSILSDWDSERIEQSHMRERLNDIAADVSRLVYAVEGNAPADIEESLFDRVQKFADDGVKVEEYAVRQPSRQPALPGPSPRGSGSAVADRMAALREIQSRG